MRVGDGRETVAVPRVSDGRSIRVVLQLAASTTADMPEYGSGVGDWNRLGETLAAPTTPRLDSGLPGAHRLGAKARVTP